MKNQFILLFLILFSFFEANATHIVGGQLFITQNKGTVNNYRIGLTMYFDAINGNPGAEDPFVNIYVFRKRDNAAVGYLQAPKIERKSVNYTNPTCGISSLETYMITYASDVLLETSAFNDAQGYYMVWDRCCRNGTITNIKDPGDAGSLFYLEFPPIVKSNLAFNNSSPVFPTIQGDYACVNTPFNFDFGGTDADGDSLVYSLVTPMQGYSSKDQPSAPGRGSSNYPKLTWIDGISVSNMIPGPKPLSVNTRTGMLSVTAGNKGLYVFTVQVDEYRKGVKIGSLTRDFQLMVVDCPKMDAPKLLFKPTGKDTYYANNEIITVKKDDPNCFEVMVVDPSLTDLIRVNGKAINNSKNYFTILPAEFRKTSQSDTMRFQICLDECFVTYDNRPIRIELIAEDGSCPVPLMDTLTIFIRRENSTNTPPVVTTSLPGNYVHATVGVPVNFTVFGKDADKDDLELSAQGQNFSLTSQGMNFRPATGKETVQQNFTWTPPCNARKGDTLAVDFLLEDMRCSGNPLGVSKPVYFVIDQSPNNPPSVSTSLASPSLTYTIGRYDPIQFNVSASDPDTNNITLTAAGRGFDMKALGMSFTNKSGVKSLTSPYLWAPDCAMMNGESEQVFTIDFITVDKNCGAASDTTTVEVLVKDEVDVEMPEIANVITPNGDGKNDCLVLETLPPGTCGNEFKSVIIYNRWGKQVYFTREIGKNWCPDDISAGYYYYLIEYTNKSFKGGLTILK
ncbi:T9SS type B sorting domain-containing protein [Dyadobacter psychrotolerans]|uniref:Gliding motility-associated C-terminal domain-containing protein n=1 Tax=Dyadobacter psychrotolerans TaxID=2541721 RepID=A0A4R5DYQ2_9BACT|nr:gliding motility-associated C-terminal domain-containing protein [Dyadobacter psychrotolerans]TDE17660.1 gliding motility-associated C-terminal domain-containing protein [Dyadobacter psychrotolerans]